MDSLEDQLTEAVEMGKPVRHIMDGVYRWAVLCATISKATQFDSTSLPPINFGLLFACLSPPSGVQHLAIVQQLVFIVELRKPAV